MILRYAALAVAAAIVNAPAAAQRGETVAGWRIESGGTGDGGRMVRMSRRAPGWRLAHALEYWRGNGGVVMGSSFRRGACSSGDASVIVPHEQGLSRATFDDRLSGYLRECPLPRAEAVALRRSVARAWPRFIGRAGRARAATEAENRAIVRHGERR